MKKLPEITVDDWLNAEQEWRKTRYTPQPKGSYTPEQYAEATNRSPTTTRIVLLEMVKAGKATRQEWLRPTGTMSYVYFLK